MIGAASKKAPTRATGTKSAAAKSATKAAPAKSAATKSAKPAGKPAAKKTSIKTTAAAAKPAAKSARKPAATKAPVETVKVGSKKPATKKVSPKVAAAKPAAAARKPAAKPAAKSVSKPAAKKTTVKTGTKSRPRPDPVRLVLCAVGQKMPAWADEAYEDFAKRFPPEMRLELKAVKAEPRTTGKSTEQLMAAEAQRASTPSAPRAPGAWCSTSTASASPRSRLAQRLETWRGDGRDVAIFIGGPDGLDASIKSRADEKLRLSDLTLPHAFVRVLLAEALYRAWSVMEGHPTTANDRRE